MNRRVAVRAIIIHDDKLLCVRLKKYAGRATKDDNNYWCTPGGGVDPGEPLLAALRREVVEELGVEPLIGSLLYIQQFIHGDTEQLELFFHVTNAEDFLHLDLAKTSHGAIEIEQAEFINPSAHTVLPKFLTIEPITEHAKAGGTPLIFDSIS